MTNSEGRVVAFNSAEVFQPAKKRDLENKKRALAQRKREVSHKKRAIAQNKRDASQEQ